MCVTLCSSRAASLPIHSSQKSVNCVATSPAIAAVLQSTTQHNETRKRIRPPLRLHQQLHAPVLGAPLFGVVTGNRLAFSLSADGQAIGRHAELDQVVLHRLGAPEGEALVVR